MASLWRFRRKPPTPPLDTTLHLRVVNAVGHYTAKADGAWCRCETPVIDIDHDPGCRRCGLPIDFVIQTEKGG